MFFGWITGTHDCKWSGSHTLDGWQSAGQFFLDAGTLEFTYVNGVKARIEGPAICLLKSVNGAELRLGKMVVWSGHDGSEVGVHGSGLGTQQPAVGNTSPPPSDPSFRIPHPLMFTVYTPNANLAGRDADFSVAVERLGACYTRVLRGTVGLTMPLCDPRGLASLPAGASAVVDRSAEGQPTLWVARDESGKVFAHKWPKAAPFLSGGTASKPRQQKEKNGKSHTARGFSNFLERRLSHERSLAEFAKPVTEAHTVPCAVLIWVGRSPCPCRVQLCEALSMQEGRLAIFQRRQVFSTRNE